MNSLSHINNRASIASLERGLRNLRRAMAPTMVREEGAPVPVSAMMTAWQERLALWEEELAACLKAMENGGD